MFQKTRINVDLAVRYFEYHNVPLESLLPAKIHEIGNNQTHNFFIYLGYSDVEVATRKYLDEYSLNLVHLDLSCDLFYYNLSVGQIILVKVADIDERNNIVANFFDKRVYIHRSQYNSKQSVNIKANVQQKSLSIGTRTVKLGDILKVKVIDILKDKYNNYKINCSMRGVTYGKLAWFN